MPCPQHLAIPFILTLLCYTAPVHPQLVTQTGQQIIAITDTTGTKNQTINFAQPFSTVPTVGVSLLGIQQTYPGGRIQWGTIVSALAFTTTSFNVTITYLTTLQITAVQISYIATISAQSGIYITDLPSVSSSDPDVAPQAASNDGNSNRNFYRSISYPPSLISPTSIVLARGLTQEQDDDTRFEADTNASGQIVFTIWATSTFVNAYITLVMWSSSDYTITTADSRQIRHWTDNPGVVTNFEIDYNQYNATPSLFLGLYRLDMMNTGGFSMQQDLILANQQFQITTSAEFATYWTTYADRGIMFCNTTAKDCFTCPQGYYASALTQCDGNTFISSYCLIYWSNIH